MSISTTDTLDLDGEAINAALVAVETYAQPERYHAIFSRIRETDPVFWVNPDGYRPFWAVTKYTDILEVERSSDRFINTGRSILASDEDGVKVGKWIAEKGSSLFNMLIHMDGARHQKLRKELQTYFSPRNVARLEAEIRREADRTVTRIKAAGPNVDLNLIISDFPLRVVLEYIGVPQDDHYWILEVAKKIIGSEDPALTKGEAGIIAKLAGMQDLNDYFSGVLADRRRAPKEDVLSIIADLRLDGEAITDAEANSLCVILATAGHDTTASSIAGGLNELLALPDQLARLQERPELIKSAVEETLRWVSPVTHFFRTAQERYVLRGKTIEPGDSLMMCYPAANRDPDIFKNPNSFIIDRERNAHLAFGCGPHLCLGLHLARMEMKILYERILPLLGSMTLEPGADWVRSRHVGGLKSLPVSISA